jgi:hypothetical protein
MNKPFQRLGVAAALAVFGLAGMTAVEARGRAHFGVWFGGPFWWPAYSYPYVVERPVIVHQPAEPLVVYPSAAQQQQLWYYCRDAQMYYPYVTQCASPWQEVPATPAPAAPEPASATAAPAAAPATGTRTAPAPVPPARK